VLLIRSVVFSMAKRAPFSERVLIMGVGTLATVIADQIRTRPDLAVRLIGVLSDGGTATTLSAPRLGRYDDVADVVRRHRPDRIIVAMPARRSHLPVTQLLGWRVRGVRIEDGPQVLERFTRRLAVESLTPSALIFGDGFRVTRAQLLVKRVMSVAIAIVALVLTAPFMAVVALGITLESRGPVFFVQERVGLHGSLFRDRKSTRLNSSHVSISYAVFCLKKKTDPRSLYAGMWDFRRKGWTFRSGGDGPDAPSGSGLYKTSDGGATWQSLDDKSAAGLPTK